MALARPSVRSLGVVVLVALISLVLAAPAALMPLRFLTFDLYQKLLPRERASNPVTIVAIDEQSLAYFGQWPWPRDKFAQLIARIAAAHPAVIGIDIIMPEPDATSPERLAKIVSTSNPKLAAELATLPTHDALLAEQLRDAPVVLGVALTQVRPSGTSASANAPDEATKQGDAQRHVTPISIAWAEGRDGSRYLPAFRDSLGSLPVLEHAARGVAALSSEPDAGVVRRLRLLSRTGNIVWPALSMEMLRVAAGTIHIEARATNDAVQSLSLADVTIPTDADGQAWVHFAPFQHERIVSAADIMIGKTNMAALTDHLVLIGFYAHGLSDVVSTPLGDRRAGVEVHAELIENVFDKRLLARPHWAPYAESAVFLLLSGLAVWFLPTLRPTRAVAIFGAAIIALPVIGCTVFRTQGLLLDTLSPALGALLTFGSMLALTLAESDRYRRQLAAQLVLQREQQARVDGELAAAQRIQLGLLPKPETVLQGDTRASIAAFIQPARSVGGDLYDFFKLDDDHLFIAIGDVSGKGVPASLFMALAKSLTKSSALRDDAALDVVIGRAQTEITRDNPEFMFMTLAALVLNLRTGTLRYVNAGHETPLIVRGDQIVRLEAGGGPPLCVIDDFEFVVAETTLSPGDLLVLVTDGVTEALNPRQALYGRERLEGVLLRHRSATSNAVIEQLQEDVLTFAAGAEPPDDIAMVVVRYVGNLRNAQL